MVMVLRGNTAADLPEKSILHLVIYPIDSAVLFFFFSFPLLFRVTLFFSLIVFLLFQPSPLFFFLTFPFSLHHRLTISNSHTKKKPLGCHAGACVTAGLH
jgi:hypothetical protein